MSGKQQVWNASGGVGFRGMRERLRQFEGTVQVQSGSAGPWFLPPSIQTLLQLGL
jgi:signal transduction histidine kinase